MKMKLLFTTQLLAATVLLVEAVAETPLNTVAIAGTAAKLRCSSILGRSSIDWLFGGLQIVRRCNVISSYADRYSVTTGTSDQCNLVVMTITSFVTGLYSCNDGLSSGSAYLVAIDSHPVCNSSGFRFENSIVTMRCSIGYTDVKTASGTSAGIIPVMTWSGSGCSDWKNTITSYSVTSTVKVIAKPPNLPICTCTTRFSAPSSSDPQLAANVPEYNHVWESSSNDSVLCFPGDANVVVLRTGSELPIKELTSDDYVLTLDVATGLTFFTEVIAFSHLVPAGTGQQAYIRLTLENGRSISATPHHLICVVEIPESSCRFVFIADVKPGSHVNYFDGRQTMHLRVSNLTAEYIDKGLYSPLTSSGTMLVDGVLVSCYAAIPSHNLMHLLWSPVRLLMGFLKYAGLNVIRSSLSSWLAFCGEELRQFSRAWQTHMIDVQLPNIFS